MTKIARYGTWPSPISPAQLAAAAIELSDLRTARGDLYWIETRPQEGGRQVVMTAPRADPAAVRQLTPQGWNVRSRVHEYGGAPYLATAAGLVFSNFADQRLCVQTGAGAPAAVTPEGFRWADLAPARDGRLIGVREDHTKAARVNNAIVALDLSSGAETVLFDRADFVAYPRPSADGRRLAWMAWDHPNMPWDDTSLFVAELGPHGLAGCHRVAGGSGFSVMEPQWGQDGTLWFMSDAGGFWNLHAWRDGGAAIVFPQAAEFAGPLWTLGQANYALFGAERILVRWAQDGGCAIAMIDASGREHRRFEAPFSQLSGVARLDERRAAMIATSGEDTAAVITLDVETGETRAVRRPSPTPVDRRALSRARPISFATTAGASAHAFYYPPASGGFTGPSGEAPPLIVQAHGGPTGQASPTLRLATQFWTSRGFAFVDVNYGGSSGYGRAYRKRLEGAWGIVDVADVIAAARHLADEGLADRGRIAIRGGSAGGFTVLAALSQSELFAAGASYFGVADLAAMTRETHKFESRYLDGLVGPWPQARDAYEQRSPIRHLEEFRTPLIIFQGAQDPIVPVAQARMIRDALRERGRPVAYLEFAGESHGFRRADTLIACAEAELSFYGQVFGFTPAGDIPPIEIENLA